MVQHERRRQMDRIEGLEFSRERLRPLNHLVVDHYEVDRVQQGVRQCRIQALASQCA